LSGDNDAERDNLQQMIGTNAVLFNQKLRTIAIYPPTSARGQKVMMIGDGLNEGIKASHVGIALRNSQYHPAVMIIEAKIQVSPGLSALPGNRDIVMASLSSHRL
jgi:magnesium-transporting ATPase (P-type)